jgi:tetratricopeptide (TPR) repeat protein
MQTANPHLQRGEVLLGQNRHDLAEKELRQAIGADPNEGLAYSYLALCLAERKAWQEATDCAQRGVGLDPARPFAYYALGTVYADRNMFKEARDAANEALNQNPQSPRYWALRARIDLAENKPKDALAAAEKGLESDPEHEACINLRAMALTKLGRRGEAAQAIDTNLARNPLNAASHANMGWTLLHEGKPRPAMDHFREALRLNPGMEWARQGILESMKARNPIYRLFLAFFLFMARLSGRARWGILLGGYGAYQLLIYVRGQRPDLAPFLTPLIVAYFMFAIGTIVSVPLFNLFLLFSRFGRYTLDTHQRWAALVFGVSLLPGATFLTLWAVHGGGVYETCAILWGLQVIPVAITGFARSGARRGIMIAGASALALLAAGLTAMVIGLRKFPETFFWIHLFGCVGFIWLNNILASARPARKN